MARDTEKNAYFYVGIPRGSQTYLKLLQEAEETGISPAKLIALRVSDWYKGDQLQTVAASTHSATPVIQEDLSEEDYRETAASNASAALDEWL